jgi:hypothetical protein
MKSNHMVSVQDRKRQIHQKRQRELRMRITQVTNVKIEPEPETDIFTERKTGTERFFFDS